MTGRTVRHVLPAGALDAPGPITLPADLPVACAVEAAAAAGALGRTPIAVVRPGDGVRPPHALGDVVGATTLAGLRSLLRDEPATAARTMAEVADVPLPHVGAGVCVEDAFAALGDAPAAWVLVDGRLAGWVRRARLAQSLVPHEAPEPVGAAAAGGGA